MFPVRWPLPGFSPIAMPAVSFQHVSKIFPTPRGELHALRDVSLDIEAGEFFGLLGPNGAGKTTLISILAGLSRASSGQVLVHGKNVQGDYQAARRLIGVVPQELVFDPFFNVREALRFQSGYFGIRHNDVWINELLDGLGLADKASANMRQLSGGMKRRVLIAQALVHKPAVIVLDEPTAGVDVELRQTLWHFVSDLNKRLGSTVLLTTHYLEEAEALSDRVVVLDRGKLVAEGSVREIRAHVSQRRVRCITAIDADVAARWPGVREAVRDGEYLRIVAEAAEPVVRRLFDADPGLHELEVQRAGLADAFLELTRTTDDSTVEQKEAA